MLFRSHASTTDPDARLYRKGPGKEAKLAHMGHLLMENRSGLVVAARLTPATGRAEREAAIAMVEAVELGAALVVEPGRQRGGKAVRAAGVVENQGVGIVTVRGN